MYIVYSQSFHNFMEFKELSKKNNSFSKVLEKMVCSVKKNISFFKFVPKLKNDYFYQNLLKNLFV